MNERTHIGSRAFSTATLFFATPATPLQLFCHSCFFATFATYLLFWPLYVILAIVCHSCVIDSIWGITVDAVNTVDDDGDDDSDDDADDASQDNAERTLSLTTFETPCCFIPHLLPPLLHDVLWYIFLNFTTMRPCKRSHLEDRCIQGIVFSLLLNDGSDNETSFF